MGSEAIAWESKAVMRLFFAVNFDPAVQGKLLEVKRRLQKASLRGRYSRPENLHLTLAFLGEVEGRRMKDAIAAAGQTRTPPLALTFDHVGCFHRDGGDIWWIGVEKNDALLKMQDELSGNLRETGFSLDDRAYHPHITLARQIIHHKPVDKKGLLPEPFTSDTRAISLMLSERVDGVLTYTELFSKTGE